MTKKRILFLIFSLFVFFIFFILINPIIGKFLTGTARIIGNETKCEIYIDGIKKSNAKLFTSKSNFAENEKRNILILYLRNVEDYNGIPVLIIDKENQIVAFPNASEKDYNVVFDNLFQSDSGANSMIPINNKLKGFGFEPNLKINEKTIAFTILVKNKTLKILIKKIA